MAERPQEGKPVKISIDFFGIHKGDEIKSIGPDSYPEVCDCCGKKRRCHGFESVGNISGWTIIDLCHECQKKVIY